MPVYSFKIISQYDLVSPLSLTVYEKCRENNIAKEECNKIDLCLVEALNNAIKHSYRGEENKVVELEVTLECSFIKLVITDYGISRSNLDRATLNFDPSDFENLPEDGMGLYIIESLMDETIYTSDGKRNVFTLIKNFKK